MSTFRPILFSDPMVRAILDGAKTQTRRISPRIAKWRVGDLLWVRETWATTEQAGDHPEDATVVYRATDPDWETMQGWRWRPSIFMPCWACRITLKITDLRMHRLQEISEEDAIAEGAMHWWRSLPQEKQLAAYAGGRGPVAAFRALWDEINEKSGFGWAVNPWVKAISFELIPARGLGPTPAGRAHLPGCTPRREMATR